ncbi:hypothetical protein BU24DRAFT_439969 [Aaosphaeria arxii CBS 175.79]|uniref:Dol-P-Man:Man(5)GlcNAc(2)-PP-Dol alpha-1,3-mannosyltransferase n=1 Tax=Aaosphaeria arxii CBS 175.79 TaxID=1450172 RepID=A0A6A5Y3N7_9PLEO|nr:uncharacterized protein BU24DRAFT_439969 [Aaosphaeria arxii CBS 175.79]KAF2020152.1 hypothetical protein BU24DRAFT_439969 [Aaosphaeria arxii CBS 175.79]
MSKLSPALKTLINAPHARPGPLPAPPNIRAIYAQIAAEASSHSLHRPSWLALTTAATMTMNSPDSMAALFSVAAGDPSIRSDRERAAIAEFMREVGLKCIGFNGVPRTINNLNAFRASLPPSIVPLLSTTPTRHLTPGTIPSVTARGNKLWESVYRPLSRKLEAKLADAHPDLPVFIIEGEYGALFSDPERRTGANVGRVTTSIVAIACLRAQQGVGPQVLSHVFGLRKAWEDGSWEGEREAGTREGVEWLVGDEGCGWVLEKVDQVVGALSAVR